MGVPSYHGVYTVSRVRALLEKWIATHNLTLTAQNLRRTNTTGFQNAIADTGGYELWRKRLGQQLSPNCPVAKGRKFQHLAMDELIQRNHLVQEMPWRHPFDLLVDDNITIDVKGANRAADGGFSFQLRNNTGHDLDCNFLVLACQDSDDITWFIVPSTFVQDRYHLWLYFGNKTTQWTVYKESWDLVANI
jgi:hypothetical protein